MRILRALRLGGQVIVIRQTGYNKATQLERIDGLLAFIKHLALRAGVPLVRNGLAAGNWSAQFCRDEA